MYITPLAMKSVNSYPLFFGLPQMVLDPRFRRFKLQTPSCLEKKGRVQSVGVLPVLTGA